MTSLTISRWGLQSLVAGVALILCCFLQAAAQQGLTPPKAEIKGTVGGSTFGDNEIPHAVLGGSVRYYLTRRLSVEPEFLYMHHSSQDRDFIVQPNLAVDLADPAGRFVPYLIGGAGMLHHRSRFSSISFNTLPATSTFETSSTTWTASAGGGLKIFITDRLFVAPEARIGREPTFRGTFSVGYVFSGRE